MRLCESRSVFVKAKVSLRELKHLCPFSASSRAAFQPNGSRCQPVPLSREAAPWGFASLAKPAWDCLGCSTTLKKPGEFEGGPPAMAALGLGRGGGAATRELGLCLSPHGRIGVFGGKRKRELYSARKPECSFTLNSSLVDSAGCCSPKITLAQEIASSPFAPSWRWPSPCPASVPSSGRRSDVPVPAAPGRLSPGPWQQDKSPARSHRNLPDAAPGSCVPAPAPLGGAVRWGRSMGTFPFSRVCVS